MRATHVSMLVLAATHRSSEWQPELERLTPPTTVFWFPFKNSLRPFAYLCNILRASTWLTLSISSAFVAFFCRSHRLLGFCCSVGRSLLHARKGKG